MPFNSLISRTDAAALVPEEVASGVIQGVTESSAVLKLAHRLTDMSRKTARMPVLSLLPTAYFVSPGSADENSKKQTTRMAWENIYINAEELAVIVPIPEAVLADTDYDIWGNVKPALIEAFGVAIDQAILYSTNKPDAWPVGLVPHAVTASHTVAVGSVGVDLYDDIFSPNGVLDKVEHDGFSVTGHLAHTSMKSRLRAVRDANGQPLFKTVPVGTKWQYELDGNGLVIPTTGAVDAAQSLLISGDWDKLVYAMRQDITYKMLDQAVLQDGSGNIIYNLAQQDMVALRAVMRLGWQLPNPINRMEPTAANRYQFAVLTP